MLAPEFFMKRAMALASAAEEAGEVPVGAVIVHQGKIIAEGHNSPIFSQDPTAHAEIVVLRMAARAQGNYRLTECELYVTLEPCVMCAGAMIHARLSRVIYGALDPKAGAVVSIARVLDQPELNHKVQHSGGICAEACGELLKAFFRKRRGGEAIP